MLANLSCDPRFSHVCARAHVDGHWLTADFYKGDRAMRESGFRPIVPLRAFRRIDPLLCAGVPEQPAV